MYDLCKRRYIRDDDDDNGNDGGDDDDDDDYLQSALNNWSEKGIRFIYHLLNANHYRAAQQSLRQG